jgi:hypothetical protein
MIHPVRPFLGHGGDPQYYRNLSIRPEITDAATLRSAWDMPVAPGFQRHTQRVCLVLQLSPWTGAASVRHALRRYASDDRVMIAMKHGPRMTFVH